MTHRDLTDEQWARLEPLLPPRKPKTGKPNPTDRGKPGTLSSRFYRWRKRGTWDRVFADLQAQAEQDGALDWTLHYVDSTVVRAHQHAAGAKGDSATEALGRRRGDVATKLNVGTECAGAGWRADVRAAGGAARVAFEVQWSEQGLAETEERQRRYRRDGIRACLLFRRVPVGLRAAKRDLPLFELVPGADGSIAVSPRYLAPRGGAPVPLATFAEALLTRRVRFCAAVQALREQARRVVFCALQCSR